MSDNITIAKNPALPPGQDYAFLRREGLRHIEQLSSALWTDYNIHDPGITILETLCYAISDLSYRASFDIKDLLAGPPHVAPQPALQAFFTAREILTINPLTLSDYRKLMIDIAGVKNAWIRCRPCPPKDIFLYADCATSTLQYTPNKPPEHPVLIRGLYDVQVAFEDEEGMGDLNSGKIRYTFSYIAGDAPDEHCVTATLELRLPSWQAVEDSGNEAFGLFRQDGIKVKSINVKSISGNKDDNADILDEDLSKAIRGPLFADVEVAFWPDAGKKGSTEKLALKNVPLNIWFGEGVAYKALRVAHIRGAMGDAGPGGAFARYAAKLAAADHVMKAVRRSLHRHRNLCEDYATITSVPVQDVAVCADIDLAPDADIEAVLARAYLLIDQYFSPEIQFHSLKELLDSGKTTDEIFTGPELSNGFIDDASLGSTNLRTQLRTSDVIALLMDIPGVLAIRNFVFSPFDAEGRRQATQDWEYKVPALHQPRLYLEASKWLVFKSGLTFLPDNLELSDTLQVLKGRAQSLRFPTAASDLPVPTGTYRPLNSYYPLQYTLPATYGVSKAGLPPNVSPQRIAQAKQLKAYLLFFEQMLVNYLQTLSKTKDFLSLDKDVAHTYYSKVLRNEDIEGIEALYASGGNVLSDDSLQALTETEEGMLARRNRALNHLMARFGEQFTDYTLMLYNYSKSRKEGDMALIEDKISFLKDYPLMSHDKARGLDYKDASAVCSAESVTGLQLRISGLLGFSLGRPYWDMYEEKDTDGKFYERRWRMRNSEGTIMLTGNTNYANTDRREANRKARASVEKVMQHIGNAADYEIYKAEKSYSLRLKDGKGANIALNHINHKSEEAAALVRDRIIAFGNSLVAGEQVLVVEHLLLRPNNRPDGIFPKGDALLPICIEGDCTLCGEEDPYSFRLTVIMNGEEGISNAGIDARRFAEDTIRREIPAHLSAKICWISTDAMREIEPLYCAWLTEMAREKPDVKELHATHAAFVKKFNEMKSVYPPATLHDCADGNDENRVYLNQTII